MFETLFKNKKIETQTLPREDFNLGIFAPTEFKTTTTAIREPTGEEPLGLVGPLAVGKQIQEAIARSGASVLLTAIRQKQLTSEELRPGLERTFKEVIFGKELLKPIEQRVAETEISLTREGLPIIGKPELVKGKEKFLAPIGVLGTIALDFTGWGGGKGQVLKLLAKTNKIEEVSNILRKIGVAEDLVGDYSKVIAETTKVDVVARALNRIEEIQKTTKVAPKIAPQAQKVLPEAIPPEKGIIPQELQPLAQEARKYKSAEDFTKAFQSEIKHGEYWHITDNPNFTIDLKLGPRDMSSLAAGKMTPGKLMVTSDLEYWAAGYPNRKFAAKLDFSAVKPEDYTQVNRGFGNEFFVKDPSKVKVEKVIPIEQALKESEQFQKNLEGIIRSKQDIADFWAQSQLKTGIPKQLEPLVIKAKGAKSFDEFVKQFESVGDKFCIDF